MAWQQLGVDSRIVAILEQFQYDAPFYSQQEALPPIFEGRDTFVHSATGTGKTAIILVAFLQLLAQNYDLECVLLAPTHELTAQTFALFREALELARELNLNFTLSALLDDKSRILPHSNMIVSTPFLLSKYEMHFESVSLLIIDEADLMFYLLQDGPMTSILRCLPSKTQKIMLSATLNEDIDNFKNFALREPALISMYYLSASACTTNYYIEYASKEKKFLQLYCLTKLKMLYGNMIIFTKSQRQGYRVYLFLAAFSLGSVIFDSKMPYNVRLAQIEQYNDVGGILIVAGKTGDVDASRGLDFNKVDFVICFDCPKAFEDYQHAIGRSGRGLNAAGASYLFVNLAENYQYLAEFSAKLQKSGATIQQFSLNGEEIEPFAYRVRDVFNKLTDKTVENAISGQVKKHLLKSDYAKKILDTEENYRALRHIRQPQITTVGALPDYLQQAAKALQTRQRIGKAAWASMRYASKERKRKNAKLRKATANKKIRMQQNWKRNGGRIEPPPE